MGIFNSLFNRTNEADTNAKLNWIELTEMEQLNNLIIQSNSKPVLLFKHSTRCGTSRMALKSFERQFNLDETTIDLYYLDLIRYRSISNEIAEKFNIRHQSPQVLLLKNENVVYHNSHFSISIDAIEKLIA